MKLHQVLTSAEKDEIDRIRTGKLKLEDASKVVQQAAAYMAGMSDYVDQGGRDMPFAPRMTMDDVCDNEEIVDRKGLDRTLQSMKNNELVNALRKRMGGDDQLPEKTIGLRDLVEAAVTLDNKGSQK